MTVIRPLHTPLRGPSGQGTAKPRTDPRAGIDGRNLSRNDLFALLDWHAARNDLPTEVLRAIALQESSGRQWDEEGEVVVQHDRDSSDWGAMQVNDTRHGLRNVDLARLKTDERYNVEIGAKQLRASSDHWFTLKYGQPFSMRWYGSLSEAEQRALRVDLFRAYNGWLPHTSSNALPYERRVQSGEVYAAKPPRKRSL